MVYLLDGTLVHPDDYEYAELVIANALNFEPQHFQIEGVHEETQCDSFFVFFLFFQDFKKLLFQQHKNMKIKLLLWDEQWDDMSQFWKRFVKLTESQSPKTKGPSVILENVF